MKSPGAMSKWLQNIGKHGSSKMPLATIGRVRANATPTAIETRTGCFGGPRLRISP
jgi:hypothetical protein